MKMFAWTVGERKLKNEVSDFLRDDAEERTSCLCHNADWIQVPSQRLRAALQLTAIIILAAANIAWLLRDDNQNVCFVSQ